MLGMQQAAQLQQHQRRQPAKIRPTSLLSQNQQAHSMSSPKVHGAGTGTHTTTIVEFVDLAL